MNLEHYNYCRDSRVWRSELSPWENFDEENFVINFTLEDDDGEERLLELPAILERCPECEGSKTMVNPAIDAGGFTYEDLEDYHSGRYDVACYHCKGKGIVPSVDTRNLSAELEEAYQAFLKQNETEEDCARERAQERAMGY
jgi:hypothetical protein